jgi:hypothetical protein
LKKILITLFLVLSSLRIVYAQDVVVGEDYSTDVVTINEELRKVNSDIKKIYPVGSIYINASVDTNPATLLGFGTWEAFGAGKVLVGLDAADADFDTVEETGGAKTANLSHNHGGYTGVGSSGIGAYTGTDVTYGKNHVHSIASAGSATQSIVQPYIVVYMWKRVS